MKPERSGPMARRAEILAALAGCLDPSGLLIEPAAIEPYCREPRGRFDSQPLAVARPASTAMLAALVQVCAHYQLAMVPQGGRTGTVGGAAAPLGELVISLERLRAIRSVDPIDASAIVEAGLPLAALHEVAAEQGLIYPVSLASEGSATVGGTLATNAGGNLTIRYGNTRAQVLGLEVVLADGRVLSALDPLYKDNSGYDLNQLFIGSEGTLGFITAACLRLKPAPRQTTTALIALPSLNSGLEVLRTLRAGLAETLSAAEFMPRLALDFVLDYLDAARDPFDDSHPWYLLLQADSALAGTGLRSALEAVLEEALESGQADDAVIAESLDQASALWQLREAISPAQARGGISLKHDISVPISRIPEFVARVLPELERAVPGIRPCVFGHLGDGNLHFNLSQPEAMAGEAFRACEPECNRIVFDQVRAYGGSIAAEHGIGQLRVEELARGQALKVELMQSIKRALDPQGLMNPGKLV